MSDFQSNTPSAPSSTPYPYHVLPQSLMPDSITLWCVVDDDYAPFQIFIHRDHNIDALKEAIKSKNANALRDFDAPSLAVWKLKDAISIAAEPDDTLAERIRFLGRDFLNFADKLGPSKTLSSIFPTQPPQDCIHIIIKVSRTSSFPVPLPQPPLISRTGSDPPEISSNVSLRKRTVEGLYDAMMEERLIYVRGTPGSGKSTLLDLLHQHILQKDPKAFVCVTWSWPPQNFPLLREQNLNTHSWLQAIIPDFPKRTSRAFLLMDEAQESFRDGYLWHRFLKDIIDKPSYYRVVVFCSYGSISTPSEGTSGGTPTDLKKAARMTLWPGKGKTGIEAHGLLLDWDEFNEVVLQFNKELAIDLDLSQKIFELTAGHVGAVCELLRLILDKMKTHIRRKGPLTLDTYYENFSLDHIMSNLSGAFTRGLPSSKQLSRRPDVSRVFRRLVKFGRVTEGIDDQAAIQHCHRNGWIYAEDVLGPQSYTLPSPLHHAALSWSLQARDNLPQFETAYALSLQVLANFKPSQMELPICRVNSGSADIPPAAQYQDEYYRSLLAITCGNVCISPEFASARGAKVAGRIDFFIPGVKWGIEITREGDHLNNHASRFKAGGAFNKWLKDGDMTDYVLLDCRTTTPSTSHPNIPNLYHVVFNEKYTEVRVFNNKREHVWGPRALQENHNDHAMLL